MLVSETKDILEKIEKHLLHHGITHTTIQFEYNCCNSVEIIKNK